MTEKVEFRKIREFGDVIGDTFLFIRQNFKPLMKTFFIICGLFIVASIISMVIQKSKVTQYNYSNGWYSTYTTTLLTWEYLLYAVLSLINYVSMYIAILSFIGVYIEKGNVAPTMDEVWGYFKHFFFRVLGSTFIMSLFLIVCFIACIIPGIYVFPACTLFYPIMILENASFGHSFERSFKLLKNEWWITAVTLFIIYFIYYITSMIVQMPAFFLQMLGTFTNGERAISQTYQIISACLTFAGQVFTIIPIVASAFLYFNLVERKENTGLFGRMNNLGNNAATDNAIPEEY